MSTKGKAGLGVAGSASASKPKATPARASSPSTPGAGTGTGAGAGAAAVTSPARAASRARRQATASRGKAGLDTTDRTRAGSVGAAQSGSAGADREKSGCGCGCKGEQAVAGQSPERRDDHGYERRRGRRDALAAASAPSRSAGKKQVVNPNVNRVASMSVGRAAALARRKAMSARGKAGLRGNGPTQAQTARAANPNLSSRELARTLRAQRSQKGAAGQKKSEPCGRKRSRPSAEGGHGPGAAQDAPWKVGAGETAYGQTVTGTQVGRSVRTTGDEASTCRSVTGTEYMGADIFRQFCQTDPGKSARKVGISPTGHGNRVTGNEVGRSRSVTGDEPGTCKRVTGSQYVGANQSEAFCGTPNEPGPLKITSSQTRTGKTVTGSNVGRSNPVTGDETGAGRELTGTQYMQSGNGKAPPKVGSSQTLRGGFTTGTQVGRSERVTGDEPGSCRNITGDDYIGKEQYSQFCAATPQPGDAKVGVSQTQKGRTVSGTLTGRSNRVTGDEPGTCKAITGTPYAGAEQYRSYCEPEQGQLAAARTRAQRSTPGSVMTGLQPGIGGTLTGAEKGACESVSGTPYVGADQFAAACPATPADPGSPDFPQPLGETPWGHFSVTPPLQAAQTEARSSAVTGANYGDGQITGPFGMASGKVTGTEEARFGRSNGAAATEDVMAPPAASDVNGRIKSRITGEGMDAGQKITGDDWERGDRVTGTEGSSSMGRNPTRRGGPMSAMSALSHADKRNEEVPEPMNKVTGGSGNTDRGALVTYSGGARG
ncbi:MAG TPA: CsoS2 family carboxysome shell protein [Gammaproteobacteria bacterium]|nr:CsoS2 family carboxysome shell protein [Gammaproteobacteria bacterium]